MSKILKLLGMEPKAPAKAPANALEIAERLGEVKIDTRFGGGYRATIAIGDYFDVQLRVSGNGDTPSESVVAALSKVETIAAAIGSQSGVHALLGASDG